MSFLQGKDSNLSFAPEFQLQLNTHRGQSDWEQQRRRYRSIEKLEFLHEEGENGDRTRYYKTSLNGKTAYAGITMTAQEQVANYGVVSPP